MFCRKCGKQIPDDSDFCSGCGTRVSATENNNSEIVTAAAQNNGFFSDDEKASRRNTIKVYEEKAKRSKKIKTLVISLILAIAAVSLIVFGLILPNAHLDFTYESLNNDTSYAITGYKGKDKNVVIPDTIFGKPVTLIAGYAFQNRDDINTVTFGKNTYMIGDCAFEGCDSLYSVVFKSDTNHNNPKGVISNMAFANCPSLRTVKFADLSSYALLPSCFENCSLLSDINLSYCYITNIEERAFYNCSSLTSAVFSLYDKLVLGKESFANCTSLQNVQVNTETVPELCFRNCISLKSFTSTGIDRIEDRAFSGCALLEDMDYGDKTNVLFETASKPIRYVSEESIVIVDTAFEGCQKEIRYPPKYNQYAASSLIGKSEADLFDMLGYRYEIRYMNGANGYFYDDFGLAIPYGERSVNEDYIKYVLVYDNQYITSNTGATDYIHIGMTFREIFEIVGELQIGIDEMTEQYYCSLTCNGYDITFYSNSTYNLHYTSDIYDVEVISCLVRQSV